jgi:hypothetical protein
VQKAGQQVQKAAPPHAAKHTELDINRQENDLRPERTKAVSLRGAACPDALKWRQVCGFPLQIL